MSKLSFKSSVLPHLIAITVFILLSIIFYSPIIFENQQFNQHDVLQGKGAGQEVREFRQKTGEEALWTNSMFGGMPAYLINVVWNSPVITGLLKVFSLGLPSPINITFYSMLSFYILLLAFRVNPYLAIAGGIAFGFSTFGIISLEAGHVWKVRAIAFMPLVLAGVHLIFQNKRIIGFALTSFALTMEIMANHLQITYYLLLAFMFYGVGILILYIRNREYKSLLINISLAFGAGIIAVGCFMGKLWAVKEYGDYSTRGKSDLTVSNNVNSSSGLKRDYVFQWSNGVLESMTLLIPNFYGGASVQALDEDSNLATALGRQGGLGRQEIRNYIQNSPTYWGDQIFVAGPSYAGAIICLLFVLGIVVLPKKHKIWILSAVLFSLILSWGKNFDSFNYLMYDYFPGYNKFRSVSMAIVIALMLIPLLGFMGLDQWLKEKNQVVAKKQLLMALAVTGGLTLLLILISGMFSFRGIADERLTNQPSWFLDALREDRLSLLRSDAFRSLLFILATSAILYFTYLQKINFSLFATLLSILVFLDLWFVDKRYVNEENFVRNVESGYFTETEADQVINRDNSPNYRVLNLLNPWQEARTSYHHKSIGGYHGAKIKRYQELIDYCLDNQKNDVINDIRSRTQNFDYYGVINMLNTKYFLAGSTTNSVLRNHSSWGNAWFVKNIKAVNSADEEISETCSLQSDSVAVIDISRFTTSKLKFERGESVQLIQYQPNYLKYEYSSLANGFIVFSEIYYPKGWIALIDGQEIDIIRVNYILRGLEVPAGTHYVEFRFAPNAYYIGSKVASVSSYLLLLILLAGLGFEIKRILSDKK